MDKAKQAVSGFLHKDGKHDTSVHETVNPAITNEHVTRTQHNESQKAIDREVHQDHYHTSVQPVHDKEVLPEQHSHNLAPVEKREIQHGDDSHIKSRLEQEKAQFQNTREVGGVEHSHGTSRDVVGEHIHHHVHESIQPVIQKETIQPSVVHTTVPVHEVHHNEAKHHTASALPAMSMSDFKNSGGHISGREERHDNFAGEPKPVGSTLGGAGAAGTTSLTQKLGRGRRHHKRTNSNSSYSSSSSDEEKRRSRGTKTGGVAGTTSHNPMSSHHSSSTNPKTGAPPGNVEHSSVGGTTVNTSETTHKKPSLLDKLNPKKDADGDGKAGFMK